MPGQLPSFGAWSCYGALLLVFLPAFPRRRRWIPLTVAAVLVGLIGLTRVMLGVHVVSDVVGGWAIGLAWLGLTVPAPPTGISPLRVMTWLVISWVFVLGAPWSTWASS